MASEKLSLLTVINVGDCNKLRVSTRIFFIYALCVFSQMKGNLKMIISMEMGNSISFLEMCTRERCDAISLYPILVSYLS